MTDADKIRAAWDNRPPCGWIIFPVRVPASFEMQITLVDKIPTNAIFEVVTFRREVGAIDGRPAVRFVGTFRETELIMQEYLL